MKKVVFLIFFIFLLTLTATVRAEELPYESDQNIKSVLDLSSGHFYDFLTNFFNTIPESESLQLPLANALKLAENRSPDLLKAVSESNKALYKIDSVEAGSRVTVNSTTTVSMNGPIPKVQFAGNSMPLGSDKNWSAALNAKYLISNFGLLSDIKRSAYIQYLTAKLDEERALQELYHSVISSYYSSMQAMALDTVAVQALELRKKQFEIAKLRYDKGLIPKYDLLSASTSLKEAENSLIKSEQNMEVSISVLKRDIGEPQENKISLLLPAAFSEPTADFETLQKLTLENRVEMKQLDTALKLAKLGVDIAGQGKNPSLLLNATYSMQNESFGRQHYSWMTAVVLNVPIFDGGATKAAVKQAKEAYKQVEYSKESLKRNLSLAAKTALLNLESTKKDLDSADQRLTLATEAYNVSLLRYSEGIGTFIELDGSTLGYLSSMSALAVSYCNYERAKAELLYVTGLLVDEVQKNVLSK